jgi:hypothetical protein
VEIKEVENKLDSAIKELSALKQVSACQVEELNSHKKTKEEQKRELKRLEGEIKDLKNLQAVNEEVKAELKNHKKTIDEKNEEIQHMKK